MFGRYGYGPAGPTTYYNLDIIVSQFVIEGNYLYIADEGSGLKIVDRTTGQIVSTTSVFSKGLSLNYPKLYIASGSEGLKIYDVSDPVNPSLQGTFDEGSENVVSVFVQNNVAYVARKGDGLILADVSNPVSITQISTFSTVSSANDVLIEGNDCYIASQYNFFIVDVSIPATPTQVYQDGGSGYSKVGKKDDYVFIGSSDYSDMSIYDVSNLGSVTKTTYPVQNPGKIVIKNNLMLTSNLVSDTLYLLDISNPFSISQVWTDTTSYGGFTFTPDGNTAIFESETDIKCKGIGGAIEDCWGGTTGFYFI